MLPAYKEIGFRIREKFQRLVRERHGPWLTEVPYEFRKYKSKGKATSVPIMVPKGVLDVHFVPQIDDCVAPKLGQAFFVGIFPHCALQAQFGIHVPMRQEIMRDLSINGPNS